MIIFVAQIIIEIIREKKLFIKCIFCLLNVFFAFLEHIPELVSEIQLRIGGQEFILFSENVKFCFSFGALNSGKLHRHNKEYVPIRF